MADRDTFDLAMAEPKPPRRLNIYTAMGASAGLPPVTCTSAVVLNASTRFGSG